MTISPDQIQTYLECLFQNHQWQEDEFLLIRGVGEKGTRQEGVFAEDQALQPALYDASASIARAAERYSQHLIGTFIVPAVLSAPKATEKDVKLLPAIFLDLDSIPAWEAVEWLTEIIGEPTMIVSSGGRNEYGPKLHAYYILDEPTAAPDVTPLAVALAGLLGGDQIFMRRTQPIRVPGSIHLKGGEPKEVKVERWNTDTFGLEELRGKIGSAAPSPWANAKTSMSHRAAGVAFSPASSADSNALLTTTITSGGADGITRFDAFSRVAGHYLHVARSGSMNEAEAFNALAGWATAHLSPTWPDERVTKEWRALLDREVQSRGPLPEPRAYQPIVAASPEGQELGLRAWAAHRWVTDPQPEHAFLVDSLIIQGEPHLFVAEGGAGKTFLLADLAMKLASHDPGDAIPADWCGQAIVKGGTCVLILCEDSQTEMHIRLMELDKSGLIEKAGDKLIILPMTRIGGAFPLTERDPKSGAAVASQRWNEMLHLLKQLPDLVMVAIDTLNSVSHGDENSAVVIGEMMREAHRVCGELGAALIINHHLRKSNDPIRSLEDLRDGIRGSTAIPSYFRINFGMFRASDWERRCKALGVRPEKNAVWRFGVAKANIMGLFDGEKTLVRKDGGTHDMTQQDPFNCASVTVRLSWIVLVVAEAAKDGFPFSHGGKNAMEGLYKRRSQLPDEINRLGHMELGSALEVGFATKMLVHCAAKTGSTSKWVDVPNGPFARNDQGETISKGAWKVPDWSQWVYDEGQGKCVKKVTPMMMQLGNKN